jgi:hypothetical protein
LLERLEPPDGFAQGRTKIAHRFLCFGEPHQRRDQLGELDPGTIEARRRRGRPVMGREGGD